MGEEKGYCLVSQQIRKRILEGSLVVPETDLNIYRKDVPRSQIKKGWFENPVLEGRIQPASFDSSIEGEAFVIDTERYGYRILSRYRD